MAGFVDVLFRLFGSAIYVLLSIHFHSLPLQSFNTDGDSESSTILARDRVDLTPN